MPREQTNQSILGPQPFSYFFTALETNDQSQQNHLSNVSITAMI